MKINGNSVSLISQIFNGVAPIIYNYAIVSRSTSLERELTHGIWSFQILKNNHTNKEGSLFLHNIVDEYLHKLCKTFKIPSFVYGVKKKTKENLTYLSHIEMGTNSTDNFDYSIMKELNLFETENLISLPYPFDETAPFQSEHGRISLLPDEVLGFSEEIKSEIDRYNQKIQIYLFSDTTTGHHKYYARGTSKNFFFDLFRSNLGK